jgi:hypothetical protein
MLSERGVPSPFEYRVPPDGLSAALIAQDLQLPLDRIEGVFDNHVIRSVDHIVMPGHTIAFVPHGTPGPHRFFLGLYDAGKSDERG